MHVHRGYLSRFGSDRSGGAALLAALAIVPVVGLAGAAIDYSRMSQARAVIQNGVDAAAIAYARSPETAADQRRKQALAVFNAMVSQLGDDVRNLNVRFRDENGLVTAEAEGVMNNRMTPTFLEASNIVAAHAQATPAIPDNLELAIVLDNTSSMMNDMDALRQAARELAEIVLPKDKATTARISIVPYVAAVNPGRAVLKDQFMDLRADSLWHANFLESSISVIPNCLAPTPPGATPINPGQGGTGFNWLFDRATRFASVVGGALGPGAARADEASWPVITPNTRAPFEWQAPFVTRNGLTVRAPVGFQIVNDCILAAPRKVSHFDMFRRVPGAQWKGCVEARPMPFDVTDDEPTSRNAHTLFVPYFYPDGGDPGAPGSFFQNWISKNNYLQDVAPPQPDWPDDIGPNRRARSVLKYDGVNPAAIDESPPFTTGPNAACPDEVLRLTGDRDAVINKIGGLNYWEGGGTIISEGLMWGWRSLSPKAPFADGKDYGKSRKVIVLMSDGKNEVNGNIVRHDAAMVGEYTAYGPIAWNSYITRSARADGQPSFPDATRFLNERMALACTNAKAAGVQIYTVLFRQTDPAIVSAMRDCASAPDKALTAATGGALIAAFQEIGRKLTELHLTR